MGLPAGGGWGTLMIHIDWCLMPCYKQGCYLLIHHLSTMAIYLCMMRLQFHTQLIHLLLDCNDIINWVGTLAQYWNIVSTLAQQVPDVKTMVHSQTLHGQTSWRDYRASMSQDPTWFPSMTFTFTLNDTNILPVRYAEANNEINSFWYVFGLRTSLYLFKTIQVEVVENEMYVTL